MRELNKGRADMTTFTLAEFLPLATSAFSGSAYIWCGTEQVSEIRRYFVCNELSTRMCFWEKTNPSPMNGDKLWLSSIECCVYAKKPGGTFNAFCVSPVWRGPIADDSGHPTPKPEWLFRNQILASTLEGDCVIDPCMGGGTALVAAKDLGRRAIGIDNEERYCEIGRAHV